MILVARRGLDRLGHDGCAVDDRRDDDARRVIAVAITIAALTVGRRITVGITTLIIAALIAGAAARPPLLAFLLVGGIADCRTGERADPGADQRAGGAVAAAGNAVAGDAPHERSDTRRVGKECGRQCKY